jgi:5-methylcytosine-specific restriction endonuclease McrA
MSKREIRCSDIPQEWKDRLARRACPVCGKERADFDSRHHGYQVKDPSPSQARHYQKIAELTGHLWDPEAWYGGTPACSKDCTATYWAACKTWQEHRSQIFRERHGICAGCGFPLDEYPKWDKDPREPDAKLIPGRDWVLDHIVPIALGGSMWDPANHQILCEKCNKEKTARDLSMIAAAKRGQAEADESTHQMKLIL